MLKRGWAVIVSMACLAVSLSGCAETSTQRMINANDHVGLANYYAQQHKS